MMPKTKITCTDCDHSTHVEVPEDLPVLWWECPSGHRNAHVAFVPFEPFEHIPGSHNVIRDGDEGIGLDKHG